MQSSRARIFFLARKCVLRRRVACFFFREGTRVRICGGAPTSSGYILAARSRPGPHQRISGS